MHLKTAYELGRLYAFEQSGLTKEAFLPQLLARGGELLASNPVLGRAAAGAALGGAVGGMSDVGAGRGALAGGLAGAGFGLGSKWGQGALRKSYTSELAQAAKGRSLPGRVPQGQLDLFAPKANVAEAVQGPIRGNEAVNEVIGRYSKGKGLTGLRQNMANAGLAGGLGAGALAGGSALMATQPSKPKHWWE